MKVEIVVGVLAGLFLGGAAYGQAEGLYVYPQKGQDADQQAKDESECWQWAKGQSGVDPAQAQPQTDRSKRAGSAVGGAARGAALGAAVGAIAGDAGKGAAAGAVVGGVGGRRRAIGQEHAQAADEKNQYRRAFSACMEGRGYTVR